MTIVMSVLIVLSSIVTAAATAGLFFYTRQAFCLQRELTSRQDKLQVQQEEQSKQFHDLLEALVVATLVSATPVEYDKARKTFESQFKGGSQVFCK